MKFYMIYSNQFAVGNKPIGIASLAAIMKQAGHQFKLFDCTQYSVNQEGDSDWNLAGIKKLAFMAPDNEERLPIREKITYTQLIDKIITNVDAYKPDLIGLTALSDDYPLGLRIMEKVKKAFSKIPTICGGVHATVDPTGVISEKCFDMVCVGEGEYVILDLAKRIEEKRDFFQIKNLWVKKKDGRIEKNLVRPYEQNLDKFPHPDWSIYPETAFYKPFRGHVYKFGDFEMSRGCPYKCSYCINVQLQAIYKQTGENFHREKSIKRVIEEIKSAREKYDIEFLKFWDETFLLMSNKRLEEFVDLYSEQINIPYTIETTSQSITSFTAKMLKKTNCKSVSLGLETGSHDVRNGELHKPTENEVYLKAFKLLEENDIDKVSFNMVGLPNEQQEDIFKTIAMNKLCKTSIQSVGNFYPYKGTPIRRMLIEKGMFNKEKEKELLKGYDFNTLTEKKSVLLFRGNINNDVLIKISYLFGNYVTWPVKLWPLIDLIKNEKKNNEFVNLLWDKINAITYFKRFKKWPKKNNTTKLTKTQERIYKFDNKEANEFAKFLIENWGDSLKEKILEKILLIKNGSLKPDFPIPEKENELKNFLGIKKISDDKSRDMRKKLRQIAKEDSAVYVPQST